MNTQTTSTTRRSYTDKQNDTRAEIFGAFLTASSYTGDPIRFVYPEMNVAGVNNAALYVHVEKKSFTISVNLQEKRMAKNWTGDKQSQAMLGAIWALRSKGAPRVWIENLIIWNNAIGKEEGEHLGAVRADYAGDDIGDLIGGFDKWHNEWTEAEADGNIAAILDPVVPWRWIVVRAGRVALGATLTPESEDAHRRNAYWQFEALNRIGSGDPYFSTGSAWKSLLALEKVKNIGLADIEKAILNVQSHINAKVDDRAVYEIKKSEMAQDDDVVDEKIMIHGENRAVDAHELIGKNVVPYHGNLPNSRPILVDVNVLARLIATRATVVICQ